MIKFLFFLLGCFLFVEYCAAQQDAPDAASELARVSPVAVAAAADSLETYRPALNSRSKSWPSSFGFWPIWYQCQINPYLPKCRCFFRWLYFCYPRWTHPMCQCSRFCPW